MSACFSTCRGDVGLCCVRVGFQLFGGVSRGSGLVVVMWWELSWGLPLAEILRCAHGSDVVRCMSAALQELSWGLPLAVVL